MGFWALFEFALKCLYVVAWPCLALGYPLCASIRAIETKSDYHTRKLVTYWILFYLISLFEHAFLKLLQRLPVWPYTKLAVVCWLVTRYFNGAVCVYKLVVRPCLSVDGETVINWFSRQKNSLRKGATVLAVVGKYIRDNGTEALVKLASKLTGANAKPCCIVDGSKSAAAKAEKASKPCVGAAENKAAAEDGDGVDASIAKRILAPVEVKRTTGSAGSSWEHPQIPAFFGEIPACQVTKKHDTTLNPQLQGREHQPADEELKEKGQASKTELLHASTPKSTSIPKAKQDKGSSLSVCSDKVDNHKANNSDPPKESVSDNGDSFNIIAGEEEKLQVTQVVPYDNLSNNWVVELKQSKWWCKICSISCTSQGNMDCHLSGTKHLCMVQKILAPVEIKETTGATGSSWEDPQIPAFFRKSPTNHMTTEPDTSMGSHFQVMEHQAADEELKAKSEASKSKLLHASTPKNSNVPKAEIEKGSSVSVCSDKVDSHDANNSDPPKEELKKAELRKDEQSKSASGNGDSVNTIAKGEKLQFTQVIPHDNLNNNQCVVLKQSEDSSYTLTPIRLKASTPCVCAEESKAAAEDGDGVNASTAKKILAPVEVKRTTGSAGSSWEHPQITAFFGEIPACQVTKELDKTLNPQLQGSEHQPADEELKEKSQASKSELLHASTPKRTSIPKAKQDKGSSLSVCSDKVDNHKANNSDPPKESVSNGDSFNTIAREEEKLQVTQVVPYDNLSNNWVVELKQSKWWCKICNISCTSQGNMDCHLSVTKHLCKVQKTLAPVEIKETTGATGSCWEDPQIPTFFRKSPTNHMTTEPDTSMASNFQVMEHQAADEELKAKSEASKSELLHASTSKNSNVPKAENEKGSYVSVCSDKVDGDDANNSDPPKEELKKAELRKDEQSKSASGNGDSFNTIAKGEKLQFTQVIPHDNLNNNQCVVLKQSEDSSYTLTPIRLKASTPCVCAEESKAAAEDGDGVNASIAKRILVPVEVKRSTGSVGSSWEHPQIPAFFGEIPTCQVTKELDTTLNPLLLGREHQPADEELKEKSQASKSELRHASTPKSTSIPKAKKDKGSSLSVCSDKVDNHKANNSKPPKESVSDIGDSFNNITGEEEKLQVTQVVPYDNLSNNWVVELKQSKWWCKICNISCTSQGNMDCHLSGTKHLCKVQKTLAPVEIKETTGATGSCWEDPQIPAFFRKSPTNHMTTEPDTSMASHFQVMEHQAADEELKAKSEASKSELLHASTSKNSNVPKAENEKGSYVSVCSDKVDGDDANNSDPPKEELKKAELRKDEQSKSASGNGDSFNTIAKGEKLQFTQVIPHDNLNNNQCVEFKQSSDSSYTLTSIRLKASKPCVGMEESKAAAEDGDGVNASIAKRILVPVEVKQSTGSAGSSWEHPQIPAFFGEIPTCQVAKELDTTLNPLLLGREHQPADEELKEKSQASKSELRHASMPKSTSIPKAKKDKGSSLSVCSDKVDNHKANNSEPPKESVSDIGDSFNNITGEEEKLQVTQVVPYDNLSNNWVVQLKQSKWWCKICNISCSSQGNMDGHLKGSKHLCRAQKIIAVCGPSNWRCMICDISCTSAVDMDCHLKGKKHLARAEEVDSPDILKTQTVVEFKESKWWCLICNMSCGCQGAMDCHLKGRKHLSCARSMVVVFDTPEWRCTICNISTKNGVYMDCHLKGKKHLSSARLI